jgi:hypothetical protein
VRGPAGRCRLAALAGAGGAPEAEHEAAAAAASRGPHRRRAALGAQQRGLRDRQRRPGAARGRRPRGGRGAAQEALFGGGEGSGGGGSAWMQAHLFLRSSASRGARASRRCRPLRFTAKPLPLLPSRMLRAPAAMPRVRGPAARPPPLLGPAAPAAPPSTDARRRARDSARRLDANVKGCGAVGGAGPLKAGEGRLRGAEDLWGWGQDGGGWGRRSGKAAGRSRGTLHRWRRQEPPLLDICRAPPPHMYIPAAAAALIAAASARARSTSSSSSSSRVLNRRGRSRAAVRSSGSLASVIWGCCACQPLLPPGAATDARRPEPAPRGATRKRGGVFDWNSATRCATDLKGLGSGPAWEQNYGWWEAGGAFREELLALRPPSPAVAGPAPGVPSERGAHLPCHCGAAAGGELDVVGHRQRPDRARGLGDLGGQHAVQHGRGAGGGRRSPAAAATAARRRRAGLLDRRRGAARGGRGAGGGKKGSRRGGGAKLRSPAKAIARSRARLGRRAPAPPLTPRAPAHLKWRCARSSGGVSARPRPRDMLRVTAASPRGDGSSVAPRGWLRLRPAAATALPGVHDTGAAAAAGFAARGLAAGGGAGLAAGGAAAGGARGAGGGGATRGAAACANTRRAPAASPHDVRMLDGGLAGSAPPAAAAALPAGCCALAPSPPTCRLRSGERAAAGGARGGAALPAEPSAASNHASPGLTPGSASQSWKPPNSNWPPDMRAAIVARAWREGAQWGRARRLARCGVAGGCASAPCRAVRARRRPRAAESSLTGSRTRPARPGRGTPAAPRARGARALPPARRRGPPPDSRAHANSEASGVPPGGRSGPQSRGARGCRRPGFGCVAHNGCSLT